MPACYSRYILCFIFRKTFLFLFIYFIDFCSRLLEFEGRLKNIARPYHSVCAATRRLRLVRMSGARCAAGPNRAARAPLDKPYLRYLSYVPDR